MAEIYRASTSTTFEVISNVSSEASLISKNNNSNFILVWISLAIVLILAIFYFLFRKSRKVSKKKKL